MRECAKFAIFTVDFKLTIEGILNFAKNSAKKSAF